MQSVPQIEPLSTMVHDHKSTLAKLANGPVILAQQDTPAAVLVDPDRWNALVAELNQWRTYAEAKRAAQETTQWTEHFELKRKLAAKAPSEPKA